MEPIKPVQNRGAPPPKPSTFMPVWAERAHSLEQELKTLMPLYMPPWRRGVGSSLGNTLRAHYLHLLLQALRGTIELEFAPGSGAFGQRCAAVSDGNDFLGIRTVSFARRADYEHNSRDVLPTMAWGSKHLPKKRYYTLTKHWRALGLRQTAGGADKYAFDGSWREAHLREQYRANEKRTAKRDATKAAGDSAPRHDASKVASIDALLNWD